MSALKKVLGWAEIARPDQVIAGLPGEALVYPRASGLPAFNLVDAADGTAWLQINQHVPWPVAVRILKALKGRPMPDTIDGARRRDGAVASL
jgi:hypothetical protein